MKKLSFLLLFTLILLTACSSTPSFAESLAVVCTSAASVTNTTLPSDTALNPVMILGREGAWDPWSTSLPAEWQPGSLEEVVYVVCLSEVQDSVIQTCQYTPPPNVDRHQTRRTWSLREAATGSEIAQGTLEGTPARQCGSTEEVSLTDLYGEDPVLDQLLSAIRGFITHDAAVDSMSPVLTQAAATVQALIATPTK